MKLLVDTNILIDHIQKRTPFYKSARKLVLLGFLREFELWISISQVSDTFYILSNGGKSSLVKQAMFSMRNVRSALRICPLGEAEVDEALESTWEDLEDALVYQAARRIRADAIITRDAAGFARSSIKVFDCDEFFDYLAHERGLTYEEIPL